MENESYEKAFTTNEISKILNIGGSTLRRWSLQLEKDGYIFLRDQQNKKRLFTEQDIPMLKMFQQMVQDNNITIENASKLVVERFTDELLTDRAGTALPQKYNEQQIEQRSMVEFLDRFEQQEQLIKEVLSRLDGQEQIIKAQQNYIDERLDRRDRALMESIRASQEQTKLLLEIASTKEENKKWWHFWK